MTLKSAAPREQIFEELCGQRWSVGVNIRACRRLPQEVRECLLGLSHVNLLTISDMTKNVFRILPTMNENAEIEPRRLKTLPDLIARTLVQKVSEVLLSWTQNFTNTCIKHIHGEPVWTLIIARYRRVSRAGGKSMDVSFLVGDLFIPRARSLSTVGPSDDLRDSIAFLCIGW
ncbi:hypothetical protein M405DRAFT_882294 [Rhizopogon salebrosus TDB-379]|nr:hypothetical protein M405DRAFT_882294 [Rhizopogon salebrosus TDB-379]